MIKLLIHVLQGFSQAWWNHRARIQFRIRGVKWPRNLNVKGPLGLSASGTIILGENVSIVNDSKYNRAGVNHPTQLVAGTGATLTIGNDVGISGASIYCMESITIGDHVLIGANSRVYDTDFHPADFESRRKKQRPDISPVVLEDDVWLCANVTVLKGVRIGARSIIAAGSVVTCDIPADCLAAGIPAKVVKHLGSKDSDQAMPRSS